VRPYHLDTTLHPVCGLTNGHNSYPSGHSTVGYLTVLALVEMVPEKREQLLQRADDYAHNRLVCGVHYPSDVAAAKLASYVVFGELMKSAKFLEDLKAARNELRTKLKLGAAPYEDVPK
jgi:acid phosphatase (class A)